MCFMIDHIFLICERSGLLSLTDYSENSCVFVLLYMSEAFDMVDHDILFSRLEQQLVQIVTKRNEFILFNLVLFI